MNKFGKTILILLCVIFTAGRSISIHAAPPTEYEVKTAFINSITKYVEWPSAAAYAASTMRLCVIGHNLSLIHIFVLLGGAGRGFGGYGGGGFGGGGFGGGGGFSGGGGGFGGGGASGSW